MLLLFIDEMQQVLRCRDFLRCPGIKTLDFSGPLQCANRLEHRIWHESWFISCKKLQVYEALSYVSLRQHTLAYVGILNERRIWHASWVISCNVENVPLQMPDISFCGISDQVVENSVILDGPRCSDFMLPWSPGSYFSDDKRTLGFGH